MFGINSAVYSYNVVVGLKSYHCIINVCRCVTGFLPGTCFFCSMETFSGSIDIHRSKLHVYIFVEQCCLSIMMGHCRGGMLAVRVVFPLPPRLTTKFLHHIWNRKVNWMLILFNCIGLWYEFRCANSSSSNYVGVQSLQCHGTLSSQARAVAVIMIAWKLFPFLSWHIISSDQHLSQA